MSNVNNVMRRNTPATIDVLLIAVYGLDFRAGAWNLVDLRSIGGNDLYVFLLENESLRRAYGIR